MPRHAERTTIRIDDTHSVSGLLQLPASASACYVFAHGAGAGMEHPFMAAVSGELAEHLFGVQIPMLFLQGTRDEFAQLPLLEPLVNKLGERATLRLFEDADHSFHVPARTGRKDAEVRSELVLALARWIGSVAPRTA